jgi:hypothetical protein
MRSRRLAQWPPRNGSTNERHPTKLRSSPSPSTPEPTAATIPPSVGSRGVQGRSGAKRHGNSPGLPSRSSSKAGPGIPANWSEVRGRSGVKSRKEPLQMCIRGRETLRASLTLALSNSSSDQPCSSSNLCSPFLMCNVQLQRRLPQLNGHAFPDLNRPTYTSEIGTASRNPMESFHN